MEKLNPEIEQLFKAKKARRKILAALPYPEKVKIVIEMQKAMAPILRARGIEVRVWEEDL